MGNTNRWPFAAWQVKGELTVSTRSGTCLQMNFNPRLRIRASTLPRLVESCQMNSVSCPRILETAYQASCSRLLPGKTTTPNFIDKLNCSVVGQGVILQRVANPLRCADWQSARRLATCPTGRL